MRAYRQRQSPEWKRQKYLEHRAWCNAHKERRKELAKISMAKPERKAKRNATASKRRKEKGDQIRKYFREYLPEYRANQRLTNPQFVLADRMRSALKRGLKAQGLQKVEKTEAMVGCSMAFLKEYLQSQFTGEMSFERPDSFSCDHFVPIIAFDLRDAEERHWSFNWRNLRPMEPIKNKQKSDTLPNPLPSWLPPHIAARIQARQ